MNRIASFAMHQLSMANTLESQRRLGELHMQVTSGKVSRNYTGVALDSRRLVNLENAVGEAQSFAKNIGIVESRLAQMENSVAGAFDVAARFRDLLTNALNLDNASLLSLNQRAEDMLQELTGMLNTRQDNRYLFAGSRTDTPPIDLALLLAPNPPLVDAVAFGGAATDAGTGVTGLPGVVSVQVDSGNADDAFQLTYDDATQTFRVANLNGGGSAQLALGGVPAAGQTKTYTFDVAGERVVLTIDDTFNPAAAITTATVTGNVDVGGGGTGAFGPITVSGTTGDVSNINDNDIEITGTAASATLTLSSTDGNFVAAGVDLTGIGAQQVTLTNATTGATFSVLINVTTGLNDAAVASADTEIRLGDFLRNVAATDGTIDAANARPGDPGYDPANPAYYQGDSAKLKVRSDMNATVEYGVTADEAGFEKLIRALTLTLNADVSSGNVDRATLEEALGLAVEAISEIPDIRSRIGSDRLALEQTKVQHEDFVVFTQEAISRIEDVDVAAAVARISIEQVQLEASYMLTARLSQLSLVNFLR